MFICTYISLHSQLTSIRFLFNLLLLSTHYMLAHVPHACPRVAFAHNYLRINTLYSSKIKALIEPYRPE